MVNLSPNHFCKVFKKITGKTLIEYLHLLRINEAEKMLVDTDASITEIAGNVGFSSITYFGRVFKKLKMCLLLLSENKSQTAMDHCLAFLLA